ncbi:MAG: guanylyltransferase [Ruminococcus sp.]|nr:guanylyltransferase [Ruminococcus sp.]
MKFDDFDREMRIYEQSLDYVILPDMYIATRLDGRSFTRLTKEICHFEAPFDEKFRDLMIHAAKSAMECGFRIIYGYTESDEISLLFHPDDNSFGRKVRKLNTTLAGEVSAAFSLELGRTAAFDCRIIPLPNLKRVTDYFLWRYEDSQRNSLNAWCYWTLRKEGMSKNEATEMLSGKSIAFKNELLLQKGINYSTLPLWQKRGTGLYYKDFIKSGFNPITGQNTKAIRREIFADTELPSGEEYARMILNIIENCK